MNPRRILSAVAAVLVFGVYLVFFLRGDSRHEKLIRAALADQGCNGDVVLVGVDAAKTKEIGADKFKETYTTTLVNACESKWEVTVVTGHGTIPRVTATKKLVP